MSDWQPIESAPRDREILVFREGKQYVAKWRDMYGTWGVSAERIPGEQSAFTEIGDIGFAGAIFHRGPTHWMALPTPPEGARTNQHFKTDFKTAKAAAEESQ